MVNEQVINETIRRMLDTGIDDETIISTLTDIGISREDAIEMIEKQKALQENYSSGENKAVEEENDDDLLAMKEELQNQSKIKELHDITTHNMLNANAEQISSVEKQVQDVKKSFDSFSPKIDLMQHHEKLEDVEEKLSDIDAKVSALQEIMKKILEVNRKILTELEGK